MGLRPPLFKDFMKKLLLFSFLLTSAVTSYALDLDLRIQNLNDAQLKKAQELSELSKQIGEIPVFNDRTPTKAITNSSR